jgi:5'-nucleotidase
MTRLVIPKHTFLNINIPTVQFYSQFKGVKITKLGWLNPINEFEEKFDHKGRPYYWSKNVERKCESDQNTAMSAYEEGYISVTPINYDATCHDELRHYRNPNIQQIMGPLADTRKIAQNAKAKKEKSLRIMLVNEEGCFHPGIISLAKVLSVKHRVNIVAPLSPLSGVGHSFTTAQAPLRVRQYYVLDRVKIFSVSGTPCDCVTLGLDKILKSRPDLIISGIDSTNNRGETIFSSGVVSAAIEGTIQNIKSIALSAKCENATGEKEFLAVARAFEKHLTEFVDMIRPGITLNINYPGSFSRRNILKYTHLTDGLINNKYAVEINPFGTQFFWLQTPRMGFGLEALEQKGDLYWLKRNYVTVTPLKRNLTCKESIPLVAKAGIKL